MEIKTLAPGKILLEKIEEQETMTDSGVILLRGTKTSLIVTKVLKVGPDLPDRKLHVKEGDTIAFKKGVEMEFELNDKKYWLLDNTGVYNHLFVLE